MEQRRLAASFLWTSDVDTRRRLRSADSATLDQTYNARRPCRISSGFCTCVEQFAVIRQECAVADDVLS